MTDPAFPTAAPPPSSSAAPPSDAAVTTGRSPTGTRWRTDDAHDGPSAPHRSPVGARPNGPPVTSPPRVEPSVPSGSASDRSSAADQQLLDAVRKEITDLATEVAEAARSDRSPQAFFELLLSRAITATASRGGAIWHLDPTGEPLLWCEAAFPVEAVTAVSRRRDPNDPALRHRRLLAAASRQADPITLPAGLTSAQPEGLSNPIPHPVCVVRIVAPDSDCFLLELFHRDGLSAAAVRGHARFATRLAELAEGYLIRRAARTLARRAADAKRLDVLLDNLHGSLEWQPLCVRLVHGGMTFTEADRVTLACKGAWGWSIEAVSGVETVHRQAAEVRSLTTLIAAVMRTGQPLWIDGSGEELPAAVRRPLADYLERTGRSTLGILPVVRHPETADDDQAAGENGARRRRRKNRPFAALIVEKTGGDARPDVLRDRATRLARQAGHALANSRDYTAASFLSPPRVVGRTLAAIGVSRMMFVAVSLTVLAMTAYGLATVRMPREITAEGQIRPVVRRHVYAPSEGRLSELTVETGQAVAKGTVLARLINETLDVEIQSLLGETHATSQQIETHHQILLSERSLSRYEAGKLAAEKLQLEQKLRTLEAKLAILRQQEAALTVQSPIEGRVATWQVGDLLRGRPIERGQRLMTVFDPAGAWELELYLPQAQWRFVRSAWEDALAARKAVPVRFVLASHPETTLVGRLLDVAPTADMYDEFGHAVKLRVAVDRANLPELRDGAKVTGRVVCGDASAAECLFQEVADTAQSRWRLWWPWAGTAAAVDPDVLTPEATVAAPSAATTMDF